jgi:predicted acetyltransferase
MPELIAPTTGLHAAFLDCRADWGPGAHEDGFGLAADVDVASAAGFADWVAGLIAAPHCSYRWIVEDGAVLGGIALRHRLDERIGHIGYGIRPSARRRGVAGWALGAMLDQARATLSDERVLLLCETGNLASARTIERNGGVPEDGLDCGCGPLRRYWITLRA